MKLLSGIKLKAIKCTDNYKLHKECKLRQNVNKYNVIIQQTAKFIKYILRKKIILRMLLSLLFSLSCEKRLLNVHVNSTLYNKLITNESR